MTRDEYNTEILSEAHACLDDAEAAEDEDGDDTYHTLDGVEVTEYTDDDEIYAGEDLELVGQMHILDDLAASHGPTSPEYDAAIDHLREMLLISYLDESDLPPVVRREQDPAPADPRTWVPGVVGHFYWYSTRQPMTDENAVRLTMGQLFNAIPYIQPVSHVSGARWHVSIPADVFARWESQGGAPVSMQLTATGAVEFDIAL